MWHKLFFAAIAVTWLAGPVAADPWKDESGHGRRWDGRRDRGETPWWNRGKGYWDGHFRYPNPYYYVPDFYAPSPRFPIWYRGPMNADDWEDFEEDRREWFEERRERQREAYERWRERQRDRRDRDRDWWRRFGDRYDD